MQALSIHMHCRMHWMKICDLLARCALPGQQKQHQQPVVVVGFVCLSYFEYQKQDAHSHRATNDNDYYDDDFKSSAKGGPWWWRYSQGHDCRYDTQKYKLPFSGPRIDDKLLEDRACWWPSYAEEEFMYRGAPGTGPGNYYLPHRIRRRQWTLLSATNRVHNRSSTKSAMKWSHCSSTGADSGYVAECKRLVRWPCNNWQIKASAVHRWWVCGNGWENKTSIRTFCWGGGLPSGKLINMNCCGPDLGND